MKLHVIIELIQILDRKTIQELRIVRVQYSRCMRFHQIILNRMIKIFMSKKDTPKLMNLKTQSDLKERFQTLVEDEKDIPIAILF